MFVKSFNDRSMVIIVEQGNKDIFVKFALFKKFSLSTQHIFYPFLISFDKKKKFQNTLKEVPHSTFPSWTWEPNNPNWLWVSVVVWWEEFNTRTLETSFTLLNFELLIFVSLQDTTRDQEEMCNGFSITNTNKDWRSVSDLCIDRVILS